MIISAISNLADCEGCSGQQGTSRTVHRAYTDTPLTDTAFIQPRLPHAQQIGAVKLWKTARHTCNTNHSSLSIFQLTWFSTQSLIYEKGSPVSLTGCIATPFSSVGIRSVTIKAACVPFSHDMTRNSANAFARGDSGGGNIILMYYLVVLQSPPRLPNVINYDFVYSDSHFEHKRSLIKETRKDERMPADLRKYNAWSVRVGATIIIM